MSTEAYRETCEKLKSGESVEMTREDADGFLDAIDVEGKASSLTFKKGSNMKTVIFTGLS